ncbi:SpvB/TcaC N-terminal domain-containing protein [Micromonospora parva]|uniref:SpvB/TcaC N-terminal domain-containing protein n=1 Tax=Micromonospora parva TaxID=1464048 RepID=UPI0033EA81FA
MTTSYPVGGGSWGPGSGSRWRGSADPTGAGAPDAAGGAFGPGGPTADAAGIGAPPAGQGAAGPGLGGPAISLPTGGGAIRAIGETFAAHPVTGTGGMSVPIPVSGSRSGFQPDLTLSYDSGAGNGPFGLGWQLPVPAISRRTDRGLPRYDDTDTFLLSGEDDLIPVPGGTPVAGHTVQRFRPRTEGAFARIERWTRDSDGDVHWRTVSGSNLLAVYGRDGDSRIGRGAKVHTWLLCETRDDRGNAVTYTYKAEDATGLDLDRPHERHRTDRHTNRYLKSVRYGNAVPLLDADGRRPVDLTPAQVADAGWLFEVVFDYGEHDPDDPRPGDTGDWACRPDPFSTYRPGFEVRTYRLCRRILMFHHFPEEPEVGADCLVRAVELDYAAGPVLSTLVEVTQRGYAPAVGGGHTSAALPPVTFEYTPATIAPTTRELDRDSLANLPAGVDGRTELWVDLDGEGLAGVLTGHEGALYYRPNLGAGRIGPVAALPTVPSLTDLAGGRQQLVDVNGDGRIELVQLGTVPAGFVRRTDDADWSDLQPFRELPAIDWASPDLLLLDLTGDGRPDLLLTGDTVLTWHESLAEVGYGPARPALWPADEDRGPRLLRSDDRQSVFLADMSGDGLTDLVRVRDGSVCYWPNVGYGRFGAKVEMDDAPWFTGPDEFDPARVLLTDVDGTGMMDLCYLGRREIRLWYNQSGNSWSAPADLPDLPHVTPDSTLTVTDLLGTGTGCLVWSSPLPGDTTGPVRYLDLAADGKPHLLSRVVNNLGGETTIRYAASTAFHLADRRNGQPWATRLPFPVQVVERVEQVDRIAGTRLVTGYRYHHGHYDGVEREFAGFGMVEQIDGESFVDHVLGVEAVDGNQDTSPELFQPPVTTKTWYHTGAPVDLSAEWYAGRHLPTVELPAGVSAAELRESLRALRGLPLRQEVYSYDGTAAQEHPYGVVEQTYEVQRLDARVFVAVEREAVSLSYDREPDEPRISHRLNLVLGPYGTVVQAAAVVYGRTTPDPDLPAEVTAEQRRRHVTYGEQSYTPDIDDTVPVPAYRIRTAYEAVGHELTGLAPAGPLFTRAELLAGIATATPIGYEVVADGVSAQRRLLSRSQVRFRDNALAPLPAGQWDSLGLGHQTYHLAFTPAALAAGYGTAVTGADLVSAGYVQLDGGPDWWIPSGELRYPADAAAHFYLSNGARDALGLATAVTFDDYYLLTERVTIDQATWSVTTAVNDYRVLGPSLVTDPNGQRRAVRYDELGRVVASALLGRSGAGDGDTLDDPTLTFTYDPFNWMVNGQPAYSRGLHRERHGPTNTRWLESYEYSTGTGGVAITKSRVHPGRALEVGEDGVAVEVDADPRWVGTGRTVVNNKGNPVKRYQPYFSTTHEYEDAAALREIGATAIRYYDPLGRAVLTRYPDGTLSRVESTAWSHRLFDANDTVLDSQWYAERGSPAVSDPEPADPAVRAAWLAAAHADTPSVVHFDSLGRAVYSVADRGAGQRFGVRTTGDLTGRSSDGYDALGRHIASAATAMHGAGVRSWSAEKGERWVFQDVLGGVRRIWDEHGRTFRTTYDALHRPVGVYVTESAGAERCVQYVVFGDRHPDAATLGLHGVPYLVFDQAGQVRVPAVDFKGNPRRAERRLATDDVAGPDWSPVAAAPDHAALLAAAAPLLESEVFGTAAEYDALNRPTLVTLPDATELRPTYLEGGMLGRLTARLRGQGAEVEFLSEQDYDALGRRRFARHGNGLVTEYFYDPMSFRLERLLTAGVRDLRYTYDPVGNVTRVAEPGAPTFFGNAAVPAASDYAYDPLYQLVRASGRELAGAPNDAIRDHTDVPPAGSLTDAGAVRAYTEEYEYDPLGNLTVLRHRFRTQAGVGAGWTRHHRYAYQDDPADATNRLAATSVPGDAEGGPYSAGYAHDAVGNLTVMPHLPALEWNVRDQLSRVDLGGGGEARFVYAASGQRLRKIVDRPGSVQLEWIFLGAVTVFRRRNRVTGTLQHERWTTTIADDTGPVAQVDVKTVDVGGFDPANPLGVPLIRYQLTNHLGSAALETDAAGAIISYEEYHPYGTTAYRYGRPGVDLSLKRYRFGGHETDDETGFSYAGARYYVPWLGRWASTDPGGFVDGGNLFRYCRNNPVGMADPAGFKPITVKGPETHDISISEPHFTGSENPTVEDFRRYLSSHGATLDPRINNKNSVIYYQPNVTLNLEGGTWSEHPGGTWVLHAVLPPPAPPKPKPAPPPPPPEPPPAEPPPPTPAPPPEPPPAAPPADPGGKTPAAPGVTGGAAAHTAPAAEKFIWNFKFKGGRGTFRGNILEWLYGMPWRDNTADFDLETATTVKQIKSTDVYGKAGDIAREATRDADAAIQANPSGTMAGKRSQAVIITETDAPASVGNAIRTATNPGRGRKIPATATTPEHVRGLPGRTGMAGKGLSVLGFGLSAFALWGDYQQGDWEMGVGDALGAVGGGLELYAIAVPGATVATVSAMTAGLVIGGIGLAAVSYVSMNRAAEAGDTPGVVAGAVGIGAGLAIAAGAIGVAAGSVVIAPVVLAVGIVAAIGVGIFHAGRYFDWW